MQEILEQLLREIEAHPEMEADEALASAAARMGLGQGAIVELGEAFADLEAFNEKAVDLERKKKEGMTRAGWIQEQLGAYEAYGPENAEILIEKIEEGLKEGMEHSATQEI